MNYFSAFHHQRTSETQHVQVQSKLKQPFSKSFASVVRQFLPHDFVSELMRTEFSTRNFLKTQSFATLSFSKIEMKEQKKIVLNDVLKWTPFLPQSPTSAKSPKHCCCTRGWRCMEVWGRTVESEQNLSRSKEALSAHSFRSDCWFRSTSSFRHTPHLQLFCKNDKTQQFFRPFLVYARSDPTLSHTILDLLLCPFEGQQKELSGTSIFVCFVLSDQKREMSCHNRRVLMWAEQLLN